MNWEYMKKVGGHYTVIPTLERDCYIAIPKNDYIDFVRQIRDADEARISLRASDRYHRQESDKTILEALTDKRAEYRRKIDKVQSSRSNTTNDLIDARNRVSDLVKRTEVLSNHLNKDLPAEVSQMPAAYEERICRRSVRETLIAMPVPEKLLPLIESAVETADANASGKLRSTAVLSTASGASGTGGFTSLKADLVVLTDEEEEKQEEEKLKKLQELSR